MTAEQPLDYVSPHAMARQATELCNNAHYAEAAQGYDEAADVADQWGDHDHADALREMAEACRCKYHEQLRNEDTA